MQSNLTIALAQCPVIRGDLNTNLNQHLIHIKHAASLGAQLVVFPELSLTGYELDLANELALESSDRLFDELSKISKNNNIMVIAGCFLASKGTKPHIGSVICSPCGKVDFYSKQYLHHGEEQYCSAGEKNYQFTIGEHNIALAVCADFSNPEHAQNAIENKANLYLVSALISPSGYRHDAEILSKIAYHHQLPTLLCNHISRTGGWETCGNNSVWSSNGEQVAGSNNKRSGALLCSLDQSGIAGKFHPLVAEAIV
ncbi:carbon-nitrogen hydrolase family protein [Vibrio sp. OCN044]|uniref:Carbon-nitrogen hydrolase family protein n=1 Tax=Vibrio tetraodonis subsp. pristinus TaxID=2695891 RepID=A0A6L8LUF3_9VIBR|nr:carbon-nitrogen hydrolase family protein [Vibrio tetraodonis]MYM59375.1 carbon-nitrogen hydrolase family protein [Vibrio tetraodonis subsp. pristinus]